MAENAVKQAPLATIRLISSRGRAPISPGAEDKQERQNSGGNGEVCFVSEWLDDSEDEALLHEAMDAFDNGLNNKSSSSDEQCLSISHQNDKSEKNLESKTKEILRTITICTCENASASSSPETGEQNLDQVKATQPQSSVENEISKDGDTKQNVCTTCHRTIAKRGESDVSENASPAKKARLDVEDKAGKFTMDPLRQFKGKYLWVSDLTAQAWCERQLLYDCTFEGPIEILETEAMKVGTEMHLKRELEVHTIKQIAVKSREDKWAIKVLNILSAVNQLLQRGGGGGASRCVIREMPIFGKPFQSGTFVVGVIDEIRYNSQDQLEVVEFKTRAKSRTLPSAAQRKTHKLQVMLYKQLFDEAVCGLLKKETILETIGLYPEATVNDEITAHALGMDLVLPKFGDYLNAMLERFQFLPKIDSLAVEYSSQDDKEPFAINEYTFDPVWLKDRLDYYNAFWVGEREVEGVDLEEVWKCNFCNYREECDWRQKMHEKCLSKKAASRVQIELTK